MAGPDQDSGLRNSRGHIILAPSQEEEEEGKRNSRGHLIIKAAPHGITIPPIATDSPAPVTGSPTSTPPTGTSPLPGNLQGFNPDDVRAEVEPKSFFPHGDIRGAGNVAGDMFPEGGRAATIMGAATAGANLGYRTTGTPVGGAAGGILGAGIGIFGNTAATSALGREDDRSMWNNFKEMRNEAAFEMAGPGIGMSVRAAKSFIRDDVLGLGKVISSAGKAVRSRSAETRSSFARSLGIPLGVADVSEGMIPTTYKKVLGRFPFIGTPFVQMSTKGKERGIAALDHYLDIVSPHGSFEVPDSAGNVASSLHGAAKKAYSHMKVVWAASYQHADDIARAAEGGGIVRGDKVRNIGQSAIDAVDRPPLVGGKRSSPPKNEALDHYLDNTMSKLNDFLTVNQFRQVQQDLSIIYETSLSANGPKAAARVTALQVQLKDLHGLFNLNRVSKEQAEKIAGAYKLADDSYSQGRAALFETPVANKMTTAEPGMFGAGKGGAQVQTKQVDQLFPAVFNANSPHSLDSLRALVGDREFARAARVHIGSVFEGAKRETETGVSFNPKKLKRDLGIEGKDADPRVLAASLKGTKLEVSAVRDYVKVMETLGDVTLPSTFLARAAVFSGMGVLAGGGLLSGHGASVALALTGVAVARLGSELLARPGTLKTMLKLTDKNATRPEVWQAQTRLIGILKANWDGFPVGPGEEGVPTVPDNNSAPDAARATLHRTPTQDVPTMPAGNF